MGDLREHLALLHVQIQSARSAMDALTSAGVHFQSTYSTVWPMLDPGLAPVRRGLEELEKEAVSEALKAAAAQAVELWKASIGKYDLKNVLGLSAVLASVLPPLEAELRNDQKELAAAVEIALAHLKRSIVVDADLRKTWQNALKSGEVECERRGAVHLLSHRLWAFKANAQGGYSDLILGGQIEELDETELRASRGLVLTEWKVASKADLTSKLKQARTQLDLYQAQTLAAVELRKVQFVVVVSEKRLPMPDDEMVDRVRRRFLNVPVDPAVASKAATS